MSLKALPIPPIPEEIARVAHSVFPRGNVFIQLRDTLEVIYTDEAFADLFPTHGQPALAPWRLALVTIFQFMEGLTDRQAADAVRDRLAWKYALSLELSDPRDTQRVSPIGPFHSERHLSILSEAEKSLLRIRDGTKKCAPPIQRHSAEI